MAFRGVPRTDQLRELHEQAPFDVANVEVRWAGLSPELVRDSLRRLMEEVMPLLHRNESGLVMINEQSLSSIRKVDGLAKE